MRIPAVGDQVVDRICGLVPQGHFAGIALIIGRRDLRFDYLEYMQSTLNVALYYVPGNHDPAHKPESRLSSAQGGSNLDLRGLVSRGCFWRVAEAVFGIVPTASISAVKAQHSCGPPGSYRLLLGTGFCMAVLWTCL